MYTRFGFLRFPSKAPLRFTHTLPVTPAFARLCKDCNDCNYPVCIIYLMYLLYCCITTRVRFAVRPFNAFIFAFIWRVLHTAAVRRQRGFSDTENEVVDDVAKVQLHSSRHTVQYYNIL